MLAMTDARDNKFIETFLVFVIMLTYSWHRVNSALSESLQLATMQPLEYSGTNRNLNLSSCKR